MNDRLTHIGRMISSRITFGVFVLLSPISASGTTIIQVGVKSNLLIDEEKVYFTQSDGTLTVLNVNTGEVLARRDHIKNLRRFRVVDKGILAGAHPTKTVLLDKGSLEVLWQIDKEYVEEIVGGMMITNTGGGRLKCRDVNSGKIIWSYDLPGALSIVLQKGKVLLYRSAEYDGPKGVPAIVLLELESGRELLHRTTPPGVHYVRVFFDGDHIYLAAGGYTGHHSPNITRYDKGRPSARIDEFITWDLEGNEIESISMPGKSKWSLVMVGDRIFTEGRVWESLDDVPVSKRNFYEMKLGLRHIFDFDFETRRCQVGEGVLTTRTIDESVFNRRLVQKHTTFVGLDSPVAKWGGSLPYLENKRDSKVMAVAATGELILLGTNFGHVEAIDRKTGQSQWMYIFPTIQRISSTSSNASFPTRDQMARRFKRDNSDRVPKSGFLLEGAAEPSRPVVIYDPKPTQKYK